MEKEGGFVSRPPLLDGTNYDYWKSRMSVYLKSIDNNTWKAMLIVMLFVTPRLPNT